MKSASEEAKRYDWASTESLLKRQRQDISLTAFIVAIIGLSLAIHCSFGGH